MLKNDYLLAKIGADTAENEPYKVWSFGCEIGVRNGTESFNLGLVRGRAWVLRVLP